MNLGWEQALRRLLALVLVIQCDTFTPTLPFPVKNPGLFKAFISSHRCPHESVALVDRSELNEAALIRNLTDVAIRKRGTALGLAALDKLGELSSRRMAFDFDYNEQSNQNGRLVSYIPRIIPHDTTKEIFQRVQKMTENGWISTNPDSVDSLPSFHLNLISDGKLIVQSGENLSNNDFDGALAGLAEIIEPYVREKLLPRVQELMNSTAISISDVFLRRYGDDVVKGVSRHGISAHYDVYSHATCVVALDDVAREGTDGLYTTVTRVASNHAALRRFFPLSCGDGVVHTWDVLHGVDVRPGLDRTSLIVWFTSSDDHTTEKMECVSPWLADRADLETNDIAQFVLASAIESSAGDEVLANDAANQKLSHAMFHSTALPSSRNAYELYIKSAFQGNAFALTRLGGLCEQDRLSLPMLEMATKVLDKFQEQHEMHHLVISPKVPPNMNLAKQFWLEGALRGNPLAQQALADELMFEGTLYDDSELCLLATVCFGLAAQQGSESANESLSKIVSLQASGDSSEDMESQILKIVSTARSHLR